jgi:type VI secretion system protein ImpL
MLKVLKKRIVLEILGIILLSLLIWFAGPYLAFADHRPLATAGERYLTIIVVLAIWAAIKLLQIIKASSAGKKLANAVASQPDPTPSTDETQLRERFAEAIAALRQSRGRDHNLYSEPWYVIIGAPGSGKSTLLQNSGLRFPLGQKFGRDAVRGVGGTRNCDWWFTDEAIFLDTAGRFTTQDSDPGSDARAWREFLALLKKYRSRRPVNGIFLTVSVADLLTLTGPGRDAQVAAARRRLEELNRELRIRLPIYLLVTKCDLMAGFTEYFDDLSAEVRKQVWGVTFPYEQSLQGHAPELFGTEFDQLVARLNERMWSRLEDEREARRRAKIFSFPQQFAALKDVLGQVVTEVFGGTRMDSRALLRGVYFTSGTQEGTPIDRLLGSIGRAFAFEPQELPHGAVGHGKAYFIERLLKEVILPESGLAGVNRRLELQIAGAQLASYIGLAIITVLIVSALTVSYSANSRYLESVRNALGLLDTTGLRSNAPMDQIAARLDQVAKVASVADRFPGGAPWTMRWGLYAGSSIAEAAQDGYNRSLNGLLLPRIAELFRQRLERYGREPEKLYEYLKAYLMLGGKGPLDKMQVKTITNLEWEDAYGSNPALVADLKVHSDRLFEDAHGVRPTPVDPNAVEQARSTIRHATLPVLMYSELKMNYADDTKDALRLDNAAGVGLNQALARRGGRSWSEPMPALYTKKIFDQLFNQPAGLGTAELVRQFAEESWVIGDSALSLTQAPQLTGQVLDLYEKDYIRAWDQVVNDLQLPATNGLEQMKAMLATITSKEGSPLRGLLKTIDENTYLVKPEDAAAAPSLLAKVGQAAQSRLGKLLGSNAPPTGPKPGTEVTEHFAPIHALVSGPPGQARIDTVLDKIAVVAQGINSCGSGIGQKSAEQCAKQDPGAVKALSQEAKTLPAGVGPLVATIATAVDRAGVHELARDLVGSYDAEVLHDCQDVVGSRYPFIPSSKEDVPIADFGHVFGYGGLFDTFYKAHLTDLVDTKTRPWHWRTSETGALPAPEALLHRFEAAEAIRRMYFPSGSDKPEFRFSLAPATLDPEALRVKLDVDGQAIEYRHEQIRATPVKWPGPANGSAGIAFEGRGGGHPNLGYQGPWAWFRLLDQGQPQAQQAALYRLSYAVGGHSATFTLEADSLFNPLGKNDLQRFTCGF